MGIWEVEKVTLQGKGDYNILDSAVVKFTSDRAIVIEVGDRVAERYTYINNVPHQGCLHLEKDGDTWVLNVGYSTICRKGGYSSDGVSASVSKKIKVAIAALVAEWLPHQQKHILRGSIQAVKRSIEFKQRERQRLLEKIAEQEQAIAEEEAAFAQLEAQLNESTKQPTEPQQEQTTQPTKTKRVSFKSVVTIFRAKGYILTRNGRCFQTADNIKFKRISDAIAWINQQPSHQTNKNPVNHIGQG